MEMYEISKRHARSPEFLLEEVLRGPVTVVGALQRLAQATSPRDVSRLRHSDAWLRGGQGRRRDEVPQLGAAVATRVLIHFQQRRVVHPGDLLLAPLGHVHHDLLDLVALHVHLGTDRLAAKHDRDILRVQRGAVERRVDADRERVVRAFVQARLDWRRRRRELEKDGAEEEKEGKEGGEGEVRGGHRSSWA